MPARGRDTGTGRIGRIAASGRSRSSGQPDALLRDRALAAVRQERFQADAFGTMGETMAAAPLNQAITLEHTVQAASLTSLTVRHFIASPSRIGKRPFSVSPAPSSNF